MSHTILGKMAFAYLSVLHERIRNIGIRIVFGVLVGCAFWSPVLAQQSDDITIGVIAGATGLGQSYGLANAAPCLFDFDGNKRHLRDCNANWKGKLFGLKDEPYFNNTSQLVLNQTPPVNTQSGDKKDTIRVLILENFPPQFISTPDGPSGLAVEMVREVAKRLSLKIDFVIVNSWPEVYPLIKNRSVDIISNMGISESRKKILEFTDPYEVFGIRLFVRADTADIETFDDLKGRKLGLMATNVLTKGLVQSGKYNIKTYKSFQAVLLALLAGEIDALPAPTEPFLLIARSAKLDNRIRPVGPSLLEVKRAMAVPKGRTDLRDLLNSGLREFKRTSEYQTMLTKWYGKPTPYWTTVKLIWIMSALLLCTIIIMASWRYFSVVKLNRSIKRNEAKLSNHILNTPLGCISWNPEFCITEWNKSAEKIFGYSADEVIGKHASDTILPIKIKDEINKAFRLLLDNKEGSKSTNENFTKDGKTIMCDWYNTPIAGENGEVIGVTSLVQDITEQKSLEEALRQSLKMEAVGQLTGGIAHDFNNMLGVIMGNLDLLRRKVVGDAKATEYVEAAYEGSRRGEKITKKLLSFSRRETKKLQISNVNDLIKGMENIITKSLTPMVTIETHLADDVWPFNVDPGEFENSLLNLSLNANDAMPDGGSLVIESSNKVLDEQYVRLNPGSATGEYVMITFSDTGTGMTPDVAEQIFEPFFTSKEVGQGTGLGLSMVYGFVQRSGGHIKVYSEPGKGSAFHIYLPRAIEEPSGGEIANEMIDEELPRGDETILVVDDEEGLVKVAVLYLEDLGYKTLTAASGKEALEILKESHHIDLIFSDVVMPGDMDGYGLAKATLKGYPNAKVLLTSGFAVNREGAVNEAFPLFASLSDTLLNKPYSQSELAVAIRRALDDED